MSDLVSIIMPSYNTAQYITETIQSVIDQTYHNWELIIVDDCSTDNTDIVIGKIKDPRIRYIKNEKNSGAAVSRNRALREANGRWVAFLDSDDLWKPEKLEKQICFMMKNRYYFSYTNYEEIDADGNKTNVIVTGPKVISKDKMGYMFSEQQQEKLNACILFWKDLVESDKNLKRLTRIKIIKKHVKNGDFENYFNGKKGAIREFFVALFL